MAEGPVQDMTSRIAEAESHEEDERWPEAVGVWRTLDSEHKDIRFVLRAALAAQNGGLFEEAADLYREAMTRAPERAAGYLGLGTVLANLGRLAEARAALQHGIELEEQQFAVTILGIVQRRLGDLKAARETLHRSLDLNPNDEEAHFAMGLVMTREDPLSAIEHFRTALSLDDHLPNAHRELGLVLWGAGRNEEAEAVLRQALIEDPTDAWAHDYLGHQLGVRHDWQSAKQEFVAATRCREDVGMFWSDLADACSMLDQRTEAERYYLKALSLSVEDAHVNARYGLFLKRGGHLRKARVYLQRAIDLDSSQERVREALAELDGFT